jgi:uncharacterized damage-inducible protein DinB
LNVADLRFLFAYDRWATERILVASDGLDEITWSAPNVIGDGTQHRSEAAVLLTSAGRSPGDLE